MTTKEKQRVTLFLNPNLLKQAKAQTLVEGGSLSDLAERAITRYLPKETIIKRANITKGGALRRHVL
jgi:hypothetical protein